MKALYRFMANVAALLPFTLPSSRIPRVVRTVRTKDDPMPKHPNARPWGAKEANRRRRQKGHVHNVIRGRDLAAKQAERRSR